MNKFDKAFDRSAIRYANGINLVEEDAGAKDVIAMDLPMTLQCAPAIQQAQQWSALCRPIQYYVPDSFYQAVIGGIVATMGWNERIGFVNVWDRLSPS